MRTDNQAEKRICELEDQNFEIISENKEKEQERVKKGCVIYGLASKEIIGELLEYYKEKKGRTGQQLFK